LFFDDDDDDEVDDDVELDEEDFSGEVGMGGELAESCRTSASAPYCRRVSTTPKCPPWTALCRAVLPSMLYQSIGLALLLVATSQGGRVGGIPEEELTELDEEDKGEEPKAFVNVCSNRKQGRARRTAMIST
jgi:hypothetical protein